jgi:hypothetical protein
MLRLVFEVIGAAVIFGALAVMLNGAANTPEFQDYPSHDIFAGPIAKPRITTAWSQKYRTRIRPVAARGFVKNRNYFSSTGPNFAGRCRVVNWG